MKLATSLSLLILFSSICAAEYQSRQPLADQDVFKSLRKSTTEIRSSLKRIEFPKAKKREADELLDDIAKYTAKLQDAAHSPIPSEYMESLKLEADLLMGVVIDLSDSNADEERVLGVLHAVAEDLELKVFSSQKLMGGGLRLIEFIVHTKKGEQEFGGYEVWYVPRGWDNTPDKFRIFDQLSSPAIIKLAPGNYLVWLKKGEITTKKLQFKLGEDGSRKEVDFPIP